MVYMDALKCKIEAPERKFYNFSVKISMCGKLLHSGLRHMVHRVPMSSSFLLLSSLCLCLKLQGGRGL